MGYRLFFGLYNKYKINTNKKDNNEAIEMVNHDVHELPEPCPCGWKFGTVSIHKYSDQVVTLTTCERCGLVISSQTKTVAVTDTPLGYKIEKVTDYPFTTFRNKKGIRRVVTYVEEEA